MADKARLKLGDVHLTNSNTGPLPDRHSTALQQRKQSSLNLVMLRLYQTWKLQFLKVLCDREILIKLLIVWPVSELEICEAEFGNAHVPPNLCRTSAMMSRFSSWIWTWWDNKLERTYDEFMNNMNKYLILSLMVVLATLTSPLSSTSSLG